MASPKKTAENQLTKGITPNNNHRSRVSGSRRLISVLSEPVDGQDIKGAVEENKAII